MGKDENLQLSTYQLLFELAKSWNQLDAGIVAPFLHQDVVYSNPWLGYSLSGASNYISYLTEKFAAIRTTGGKTVTKARMASIVGSPGDDCILLTQITGSEIRQLLFFIQSQNNRISHIYAREPAYYPQLQLTGIYP